MNQQSVPLELMLDDCVTAVIEQGHPITTCLQHYPEQHDVLEPLLHLAQRLQKARAVQPDPEFRQVAALRMQNMIAARPRQAKIAIEQREPNTTIWQKFGRLVASRQQLTWARVVGVLFVIWLSLSTITVFAASDALPGQPLYPVKQLVENTQLNLTFDEAQKAQLHLNLASERLQETAVLVNTNDTAKIAPSLAAYQTEIETAVAFLKVSGELTTQEKETLASLVVEDLAAHEMQLITWQAELIMDQELVAQALQASREGQSFALALLGEVLQDESIVPAATPLPIPSSTSESPTPIPTPGWTLPPYWPSDCPSPLEWPNEWPEECTIPEEWPPAWPEPPGGWPIPPLPSDTIQPPAGWTPPPYWPPECPVPQKWPFSWPEGCVLLTGYPPDWTEPPGGWPDLATPLPIPTVVVPSGWPTECPLPPEWPDEWEGWPEDCQIPTDFEWPGEWPTPPGGWPVIPPPDEWVDSPDQLPPRPTGFPDLPDDLPPPGEWPTPPPDGDDEPPPWPWP